MREARAGATGLVGARATGEMAPLVAVVRAGDNHTTTCHPVSAMRITEPSHRPFRAISTASMLVSAAPDGCWVALRAAITRVLTAVAGSASMWPMGGGGRANERPTQHRNLGPDLPGLGTGAPCHTPYDTNGEAAIIKAHVVTTPITVGRGVRAVNVVAVRVLPLLSAVNVVCALALPECTPAALPSPSPASPSGSSSLLAFSLPPGSRPIGEFPNPPPPPLALPSPIVPMAVHVSAKPDARRDPDTCTALGMAIFPTVSRRAADVSVDTPKVQVRAEASQTPPTPRNPFLLLASIGVVGDVGVGVYDDLIGNIELQA
jgi:hypothetical protein